MHEKREIRFTLLVTSDVHSRLFPDVLGPGMLKASKVIQRVRSKEKHMLLIDNGDLIQGTPLADYAMNEEKGIHHPAVLLHRALGYDAAVLGNHEFNYGRQALEKVVLSSGFPWLSANVVKKGTKLPFFGPPYILRDVEGVLVAVLGLTTSHVPVWEPAEHIKDIAFLDPVDTARRWVAHLKEKERVDLIILAYHGGLERDPKTQEAIGEANGENQGYALVREVEGIAAVITGHQHLLVQEKIDGKPIVQTGTAASHVGKITFTIGVRSDRVFAVDSDVELLPVAEQEEDEALQERVRPVVKAADKWMEEIIGRTEGDFSIADPMQEVWLKEHPLIEWINRVQMKAAGTTIACTALLNPNIRGLGRRVSRKDILEVYPFPNSLVVMRLTAEEIKQALEVSASFFTRSADGRIDVAAEWRTPRLLSYNYDMWEGIVYEMDVARPRGERVRRLRFPHEPDGDGRYAVAVNRYRASGTGGYAMFDKKKIVKEIPVDISRLLMKEVSDSKVIRGCVNHNWKVVV